MVAIVQEISKVKGHRTGSPLKSSKKKSLVRRLTFIGEEGFFSEFPFQLLHVFQTNQSLIGRSPSFAIVLWELMTHRVPFDDLEGHEVAYAVVHNKARPEIRATDEISPFIVQLIKDCWDEDPNARPHFGNILNRLLNGENIDGENYKSGNNSSMSISTGNHSTNSLELKSRGSYTGFSVSSLDEPHAKSLQNMIISAKDLPPGQAPLHEYIGAGGVIMSTPPSHQHVYFDSNENGGSRIYEVRKRCKPERCEAFASMIHWFLVLRVSPPLFCLNTSFPPLFSSSQLLHFLTFS